MKGILFVVTFLCSSATFGQYIQNNLDIGANYLIENPFGPRYVRSIPTLFSNYSSGLGYTINGDYRIMEGLKLGIRFKSSVFKKIANEGETPILENPQSDFKNLMLSALYYKNIRVGSKEIAFGIMGMGGPVIHKITCSSLKVDSEIPIENLQTSFKETEYGFIGGPVVNFHLSNQLSINLNCTYSYIHANNFLYSDHSFQSFGLGFGLYFKFLRSKYFRYD